MKRFSTILAALALVVSMQGCDNGPSVEPEIPDNPTTESKIQLRLTGSIGQTTRVNEAGFEADDEVGVFISDNGTLANSGNFVNNTPFTYNNGEINAPEGGEVYWESSDTSLDIYAYYPYNSTITSVTEYPFAVEYMQNTKEGFYNSDFIYASALDIAPQKTAVDLKFKHALTKINIILTAGNGVTEEELIAKEKEIQLLDLITRGSIDLSTGIATPGNSTSTIYPYNETGTLKYSAIVFPQERPYDNALVVDLKMDGKTYKYNTSVSYEAGTEYTYTFEIEDNELSLTSSDIEKWIEGEVFQGEFEEILTDLNDTFEQYLLNEVIYEPKEENQYAYVATDKKIDANNDGRISATEAKAVKYINVIGKEITNLSGIEHFVNLECLYLNNNKVEDIDLSKNKALHTLTCNQNQLSTLDVSNNTELTFLYCESNKLTTLDFAKNTELRILYCRSNQLTALNISKNTALTSLSCSSNQLTTLDVSNNTELTSLGCSSNQLTALDVSNNTELTYLDCDSNQLTTLDVTKNTKLTYLTCRDCPIKVLDVTKSSALKTLYCRNCQLTTLNISNCTALEDLDWSGNMFTTLNISNAALKTINCNANASLSSINLSNCTALESLSFAYCKLTTIDVSDCPALKSLHCIPQNDENGNNILTTIYLANGQSIEDLFKPSETVIKYK